MKGDENWITIMLFRPSNYRTYILLAVHKKDTPWISGGFKDLCDMIGRISKCNHLMDKNVKNQSKNCSAKVCKQSTMWLNEICLHSPLHIRISVLSWRHASFMNSQRCLTSCTFQETKQVRLALKSLPIVIAQHSLWTSQTTLLRHCLPAAPGFYMNINWLEQI